MRQRNRTCRLNTYPAGAEATRRTSAIGHCGAGMGLIAGAAAEKEIDMAVHSPGCSSSCYRLRRAPGAVARHLFLFCLASQGVIFGLGYRN